MSSLLTFNGVPPQIIGSLSLEQRTAIVAHPWPQGRSDFSGCGDGSFSQAGAFARFAAGVVERFTAWGAHEYHDNGISRIVDDIQTGASTFSGDDLNVHSDLRYALEELHKKRIITLRLLCVSSMPARFADLTGQENIENILSPHRTDNPRLYKSSLLDWAQENGLTVTPNPWDVIVFDAFTPHQPALATEPHRRIFYQSWMPFALPLDWQQKLANGDAPRFG